MYYIKNPVNTGFFSNNYPGLKIIIIWNTVVWKKNKQVILIQLWI